MVSKPLAFWFSLTILLVCNAASLRHPLELHNDSTDKSVVLSDEQGVTSLAKENLPHPHEARLSLHHVQHDDGPMLTLPQFMDRVISSAFSSVDRMSSGLLSDLAGPNIEYAKSEDGKRLIVRLHLPAMQNTDEPHRSPPKVSVAVLGRSHLRIKLDMRGDSFQSFSQHTYGLPLQVTSDGVTVTPQEDGTVHVSLKISEQAPEIPAQDDDHNESGTQSFLERRLRNPLFPVILHRESLKGPEEEVVEELPKPEEVEQCRLRYLNEKILRKKCTCDITPSRSGRAVCYGALISKALSVSRRLGMHDFATSAKHHAIECADVHVEAVSCLEKVSSELLRSLYNGDGSGEEEGRLKDRVRAAIESEDDGPSNFEPSYRTIFSLLMIAMLVGLFAFGAILFYSIRRFGSRRSNRFLSELSSVLTQTARPNTSGSGSSGKQGSRLGPFQGTSAPSNPRIPRTAGAKLSTSDSKIA